MACAVGSSDAAGPYDVVSWRSKTLSIPYAWSGDATPTAGSRVILYYSADRGRSWQPAGEATPQVRAFRFTAPGDGEYWFAVRTYDPFGRATPAGPLAPEMRVAVDTVAPQLSQPRVEWRDGAVSLEVAASDAGGLGEQTLHAYAQADGAGPWLPITLTTDTVLGTTTATGVWAPPQHAQRVAVRVSVEDAARNRAHAEATAIAPVAEPAFAAAKPAAAPRHPLAGRSAALDPFAALEQSSPAAPPSDRPDPPTDRPAAPPEAVATRAWPFDRAAARPPASSTPDRSAASPFGVASFQPLDRPSEPFDLPLARPERLVNSTEFEFDYELDQTGRWGVAKVELWGTEDGGRSWRPMAVDSDRRSPIHVSAPGEGTYGFRLVVEPVGGLRPVTPVPGDEPEATVGVDLQAPRVTLRSARQGEGYFADQLAIEFRASDPNLASRPIDLYYSDRPTGPWAPIATGLANTGRHSWRLQRHLPRRVFLRVEARDGAGNVGHAVTPEAITLDVPTSSGKLGGVRASG